jgi:hypothetical protein
MFGAREPASTIKLVDDSCEGYRKLFPEVRSCEAFKYLHVGIISDIKRKTLPTDPVVSRVPEPDGWDWGQGWKNLLNNLRLVIQPYQFFN